MKHRVKRQFLKLFPAFKANKELIRELLELGAYQAIDAGQSLMVEGEPNTDLILVLQGAQRVYKTSEAGREITLYEIGPGEICSLSASSILAKEPNPASAVAVTSIEAIVFSVEGFRHLVFKYSVLRDFLFTVIARESAMVMDLIAEVTFKRMDQRLHEYLVSAAKHGHVRATHKKIANDLGTAREVVSRLLKDFERKGMVRLHRGYIDCSGL